MQKEETLAKQLSALLLCSWLISGCGGGSTPPPKDDTNTLKTDSLSTLVENKSNNTQSKNNTTKNQTKDLVSSFDTRGPAEDVAASKEALFVAEGDKGVEIIKIGYHDRIDHQLVATITGINATQITLSADQTKLYIQNKEGYVNIYDIRDIHNPTREKIVTKDALPLHPVTKEGTYEFVARQNKGMDIYDISNPSNKKRISTYKQTPVYSVVLVDQDTKALVATKQKGISLLDVTDPTHIKKLGTHPLPGNTLGLSTNETSGLLFVAKGDSGVEVFNLNILIDDML